MLSTLLNNVVQATVEPKKCHGLILSEMIDKVTDLVIDRAEEKCPYYFDVYNLEHDPQRTHERRCDQELKKHFEAIDEMLAIRYLNPCDFQKPYEGKYKGQFYRGKTNLEAIQESACLKTKKPLEKVIQGHEKIQKKL